MALVRYSVLYNGPYAVYTSRTGLVDLRTGLAELGGGFNVGDFMDLTEAEANSWSLQYAGQGPQLHAGRYRICQAATTATAANTKQGAPVGIATGNTVQQAVITAAGSGGTAGTYNVASSTSGGTATSNLQYTIGSSGQVISAIATTPGAGFTSTPTWSLAASGTSGTVVAQMTVNESVITSFDASAVSLFIPRGLFLNALTAAQISAGAFVLIQEQGIGSAQVTTATNTAIPCSLSALTGGAITSATAAANTIPAGFLGFTLDVASATAGALTRVQLQLPQWAG